MKKQLTAEQAAARDARRARFREMVQQIGKLSEADRLTLAGKMPGLVTVEGHSLSLTNTMLLAMQCPGATVVGGFRQWIKAGRCVRKGEHGAMIWAPKSKGKADAASSPSGDGDGQGEQGTGTGKGKRELAFLPVTVFDIGQTQEAGANGNGGVA